jgi:hypothetical protein
MGYSPVGELNPAEYLVNILSQLPLHGSSHSIESLANEVQRKWSLNISHNLNISHLSSPSPPSSSSTLSLFLFPLLSSLLHTLSTTLSFIHIILQRDSLKESRRYYFWCLFFFRSFLLGVAIGAVWFNISCEGFALLERLGLFLTVYLLTSLWITEFIPFFHQEKIISLREYESNAMNKFSTWCTYGVLYIPLLYLAINFLSLPIYLMADLHGNTLSFTDPNGTLPSPFSTHYQIFTLTIFLGFLANLSMNYLLLYLTPNPMIHILIFPGISLAVQSLLSGYAVLPSTITPLLRWVVYINPCFLVMDSLFVNEFKHNACADSFQNSFSYYEEGYSYTIPQQKVLWWLVVMICVLRILGFVAMNLFRHIHA